MAAPKVPELIISKPVLKPLLGPEMIKSKGGSESLSVPKITQSAGVPLIANDLIDLNFGSFEL